MTNAGADPIRVYLIAPPLVSWGLERLINSAQPRLHLAGSAPTVEESLGELKRKEPDIVVLDLEGDEPPDSVSTLRGATNAKVLVVTGSRDLAMIDRAVMSGVCGVVRNSNAPSLLLKAVEKVHEGELWIDRATTGRIFMEIARMKAAQGNDPNKGKIATLTLRERKTIAAVTADASVPVKVVADRLCISEHTLRNHLTSVYAKLGVANRIDLYKYAIMYSLNEAV